MDTDNSRFKVILTNAKLICLSKFQLVQTKFGETNTEVIAIKKEMDDIMASFDNPDLWTQSILFDEAKITGFVTTIDGDDPADLTKFATDIRAFISYLEEEVLKVPLAAAETTTVSDFNALVLNALTQTQQKIGGRKKFFKNNGRDLDTVPAFQAMEAEQKTALATYRTALRNNEVQSQQTDVIIFQMLGDSIQASTVVAVFLDLYKKLTTTIQSKLPVPANNDDKGDA